MIFFKTDFRLFKWWYCGRRVLLPSHGCHFLLEVNSKTIRYLVMPDWNALKGIFYSGYLEPVQCIQAQPSKSVEHSHYMTSLC